MKALRIIGALFAGLVTGCVAIILVEMVGHAIFPTADIYVHDGQSFGQVLDRASLGALIFVMVAWSLGTFAGSSIATWLAPTAPAACGIVIGVFFFSAAIMQMLAFPHPVWMWIAGLIVIPVSSGMAVVLLTRKTHPTPAS